jgi:hypothetical protein
MALVIMSNRKRRWWNILLMQLGEEQLRDWLVDYLDQRAHSSQ